MKNIDNLFMRLAVIWFIVGVALGIGMAASHQHTMTAVHAHINLLGWVSMGLFAAFYRAWSQAAATRLAKWHFWLYVPGHLVMMATLALLYAGRPAVEPILGIASVVVGLGILCFAAVVWKHTGAQASPAVAAPQDALRTS